jgi:hypothetical protein
MKKLFMVIVVLLVVGCGGISDEGIRLAYEQCENHGGVDNIFPVFMGVNDSSRVACVDGTVIEVKGIKK